METSKRRLSCPLTVQYIWDSIAALRAQKQVANKERIYKMLNKQYNMTLSDVERQLKYAVRDNLISCVHRIGCKGSRRGVEAESYWFTNEAIVHDGHDWYCFSAECHRSGEVYSCDTCFRVYHPFCIKEDVTSMNKFICPVCKLLKSESTFKISNADLNVLLSYTCNRLKAKVSGDMALTRGPSHLKDFTIDHEGKLHHHIQPTKESAKQSPVKEDQWRQDRLIYKYMDLGIMEEKAVAGLYSRLEEYQVDAQTIVHNIVIYYGVHSSQADLARQMLRDCNYDLAEIQQCRDCYRMSNEKQVKFWFCQPCDPPHELVYAKQRGYPYWPAKVIRKLKATYDVRFFGGFHQRAKVEKMFIKPITTNIHSLQIKRSSGWNKAMEELKQHREILDGLKLVPISSTLDSNDDSGTESEGDPKLKRPYVKLEKLSDVEDDVQSDYVEDEEEEDENSSHSEFPEKAIKSEQDDMNVVSSSSQVAGDIGSRNISTQTGALMSPRKTRGSKQNDSQDPSSSRSHNSMTNQSLKELRVRIESEFNVTKEACLRELAIKLDKKHFEDTAILTSNEKEKRRQLEERLNEIHRNELDALKAKHLQEISEVKKKQWCWNCESEAIYHCCWNTSYCSMKCQQTHWQKEHKFTCRHKRT